MAKTRVFISFDYENDRDIKTMLVGQAKFPDSSFDFTDASVQDHITGNWKEKVKQKIKNCDTVCVICGQFTHLVSGVSSEIKIAQELNKPYFLLRGRPDKTCTRPAAARSTDTMNAWTWPNLKRLVGRRIIWI